MALVAACWRCAGADAILPDPLDGGGGGLVAEDLFETPAGIRRFEVSFCAMEFNRMAPSSVR